ncbi:MAG: S8 family serine peptidase [Anaerolineae bacterium]|nr:MAG: S8 family serine peptidase [Anaerolineae bacterium]
MKQKNIKLNGKLAAMLTASLGLAIALVLVSMTPMAGSPLPSRAPAGAETRPLPWPSTSEFPGQIVLASGNTDPTIDTRTDASAIQSADIEVSPASFDETLAWGARQTRTLTITNNGPDALDFDLVEIEGSFAPLQVTIGTALAVPPTAEEKVGAQVWAGLESAADGRVEFFVLFGQQADLRPAYAIRDWEARGAFVLQALRETAAASQAGALAQVENLIQTGEATTVRSHYIVNAMYVRGSADVVAALAARPEVAAIRAVRYHPVPQPILGEGLPTINSVEWNIAQIGADQAWSEFGVRGQGIVVANIDTGVRYTHDALVNQYRGNQGDGSFEHNYNWWDPDGLYDYPTDNNGHGSHTMGTMVGDDAANNQIGVAPAARWIAAQGCDSDTCSDADLIACAEWILAPWNLTGNRGTADPTKRPHVVNNSWGGGGGDHWYMSYVDAWRAAGIFPAFSTGNEGPNCDTAGSPGDYAQSFASGATDSSDRIAGFSSRGPSSFGVIKPDVSAPGVNVRSAWNGSDSAYHSIGGTSMASPHTAGLVALLWSANPNLIGDLDRTAALIKQTAFPLTTAQGCSGDGPDDGPNNVYGWGRIDAYQAVSEAGGDVPWLVEEPVSGTVPAYSTIPIAITFDAAQVSQPGTYRATLRVNSNDTYSPTIGVPATMVVQPDPNMGRLGGTVTSDRPGGTLGGAQVEVISGTTSIFSVTTDTSGSYGPWWLTSGAYTVIVSADGYVTDTQALAINAGGTTTHDVTLTLNAPRIELLPATYDETLTRGMTRTRTLTISNTSPAALEFEVGEMEGGFAPLLLPERSRASARHPLTAPGLEGVAASDVSGLADLTGVKVMYDLAHGEQESSRFTTLIDDLIARGATVEENLSAMTPDLLAGYDILWVEEGSSEAWTLAEQAAVQSWAQTGHGLIVHGDQPGQADVLPALFDIEYVWGGTSGPTENILPHPVTQDVSEVYVPLPLRSLSPSDPALSIVDDSSGTPHICVNTAGGGRVVVVADDDFNDSYIDSSDNRLLANQAFDWLALGWADVPWLSEKPITGTVSAYSTVPIAITFDASVPEATQLGKYYATLSVKSDDPYSPSLNVPVTMTVHAPNAGMLIGRVTSDRPGGALGGALVEVISGTTSVMSATTDASGSYGPWWPMSGTYTVTVSAGSYVTDAQALAISAGGNTTHDVTLILDAPWIEVSPTAMDEAVMPDQSLARTLVVSNTGPAALAFTLGADASWFSAEPVAGTVLAYSARSIAITFDATGLDLGDYTASLVISNTDPYANPVIVPITMRIQSGIFLPIILRN